MLILDGNITYIFCVIVHRSENKLNRKRGGSIINLWNQSFAELPKNLSEGGENEWEREGGTKREWYDRHKETVRQKCAPISHSVHDFDYGMLLFCMPSNCLIIFMTSASLFHVVEKVDLFDFYWTCRYYQLETVPWPNYDSRCLFYLTFSLQ